MENTLEGRRIRSLHAGGRNPGIGPDLDGMDDVHPENVLLVVGNLVFRASDSRPPVGLGSMPDATKYPSSTHGVRAR
ncbi:hypothetical protein TNCV_244731 [Trichonephila clavipes]|uniref:Uncharacterized protein n=1 Tax=Trichonephila clavipes TaxID=2585209 RepID=A0A8X6RJX1_TRICX|nr:hypothetical protein TNCV_244731 [Trichonephila clavipes]